MASRNPGQPPQKPVKRKPKASMTQEELERRENVRRRLFSGEDDAMIVDSPETSPIDEALDEAYRRYDFNFRTENPIAGGTWQWESLSDALPRAQASPSTSAGSPVVIPPPREQHPRTGESLNSARPARVRSANRPRSQPANPQRRNRGRLLVRPSTARLDAAAALPIPELQGPRPPPVRSANRPRLAINPQRRNRGRLLVRPSTARLDAAAALPFPELQGPRPPPVRSANRPRLAINPQRRNRGRLLERPSTARLDAAAALPFPELQGPSPPPVRSANRPRLAINPQRRNRGRLLVQPSTARLDAAAALPFPELQGPSPPPRRMWAFSRDVPPPAPRVAPSVWPRDFDYGSKQ